MKRDDIVFNLIEEEHQRQLKGIELIASENFVSDQVMQAMGSCMTNKYAEGYPGRRYYGGCEVVDKSEQLAIERLKQSRKFEELSYELQELALARIEKPSMSLQELADGLKISKSCLNHRMRKLMSIAEKLTKEEKGTEEQ